MLYLTLLVNLLLSLTLTQGSRTPVFIQTKQDLLMDVREKVHVGAEDLFYWRLNDSNNIVRFTNTVIISENFTGRVKFFKDNYSMILKNVQLTDSGLYTSGLFGDEEKTYTEYDVTVRDPVSPVKLTVDSVSNSSESCNFNVSCRTEDVHMRHSFTCNNQICDNKQEHTETTPSAAALHLYLSNMAIICNHSNQVSWTQDMTDIQQICPLNDNEDSSKSSSMWIVAGGVAGVVVVIVCFAAALFYRRRQKKKRENQESTVYAVPEVPPVSALSPGDTADDSPTSTYSFVKPHSRTLPAAPTESLYATVERPSRS